MKNHFYLLAFLAVFAFSCEDDDTPVVTPSPEGAFETGFFVSNEGAFMGGIGTISHITEDFGAVENDIYQSVNGDNLGNIAQSMAFSGDTAYVVTNVSARITVVDKGTFVEIARITEGLENPRFMEILGDTGYVSNWGDPNDATDDYIAVVDLLTNTITSTISVGEGPEEVLIINETLYVAHQGGFGVNNIISVISTSTNSLSTTIEVGDVPNTLQEDSAGNLIVLSGGISFPAEMQTAGRIDIINTSDLSISETIQFDVTEHPNYLNVVGTDVYYFLDGAVFKTSTTDVSIETEAILSNVFFFNMRILADGTLAGCNARDFASQGAIELYDLDSSTLLQSLDVGIIPGNIYPIF